MIHLTFETARIANIRSPHETKLMTLKNSFCLLTLLAMFVSLSGCSDDAASTGEGGSETASGDSKPEASGDDKPSSGRKDDSPDARDNPRNVAAADDSDPIVMTEAEKESDEAFTSGYKSRQSSGKLKSARIPMRSDGPKSLDPIRGSTVYENRCASQVVETLLQYKYLVRPFQYEPLLLESMPTSDDGGITWKFKLKEGVHFRDDACFEGGKGRVVTSEDVFYSLKRLADVKRANSKSWWLIKDTIKGFNEYKEAQNEAAEFDYDANVEGMQVVNDREFNVVLERPQQAFLWKLCMFQTSIVAREAVEKYGNRFGLQPVGTGPFVIKEGDWQQGLGIKFTRNENYHECYFPADHMQSDEADELHLGAGRRLPILDEVQVVFYKTDQPMWLEFKAGKLDYAQVPAENFREAFSKRTKKLTRDMKKQGMKGYPVDLLDFIFRGFNMEDSVLGGYTPEKKALRQAICSALDWDEQNEAFYNGINKIYDGVIPPGLDGYPNNGQSDKGYRGPDLERSRELLAKAGYPGGKGLPTIDYYTSRAQNGQEQSEMISTQLKKVGINVQVHLLDFSQLIQKVDEKSAQFFSFAWSSDYPDGENNLALFYGPNEAPGANHFNYKNAEYDKLYEEIVTLPPSADRTAKYEQMQATLLEDCPYAGSMARTRFFVVTPQVKYYKPVESFENWYKYVDVVK